MEGEQYTAVIVNTLVSRYPSLAPLGDEIQGPADADRNLCRWKKTLICGNGGSAADADHIVGELMKGFVSRRAVPQELRAKLIAQDTEMGGRVAESLQMGLPAIALTQHAALLTAFANDVNPASVFAQQVLGYGVEGDMFWGISTSGNSKNVVYAAITARALGLKVIGMTGSGGGARKVFRHLPFRARARDLQSTGTPSSYLSRHLPCDRACVLPYTQRRCF